MRIDRLRQSGGGRREINREAAYASKGRHRSPVTPERSSAPHALHSQLVSPAKMWDDADIEEEAKPAEPEPTPEVAAPEAVAEEKAAEEAPAAVVKGYEPKKLIFRHWIRPKFLQYTYLYKYRHNYYDDVINYLDRRNRGLEVETPRAQTWAERALRTYVADRPIGLDASGRSDKTLLRGISTGARFHRYHSKSLISRKYSTLGFNTVSI